MIFSLPQAAAVPFVWYISDLQTLECLLSCARLFFCNWHSQLPPLNCSHAQAALPHGLPALQAIPDLGLPAMPAIELPATADALLAPLPMPGVPGEMAPSSQPYQALYEALPTVASSQDGAWRRKLAAAQQGPQQPAPRQPGPGP